MAGSASARAAMQLRMSPIGGMPSSSRSLPDDPPSSATVTTAVMLLVCSLRPRSSTDRPVPPPMATMRGPRARNAALVEHLDERLLAHLVRLDQYAQQPPRSRSRRAAMPAMNSRSRRSSGGRNARVSRSMSRVRWPAGARVGGTASEARSPRPSASSSSPKNDDQQPALDADARPQPAPQRWARSGRRPLLPRGIATGGRSVPDRRSPLPLRVTRVPARDARR